MKECRDQRLGCPYNKDGKCTNELFCEFAVDTELEHISIAARIINSRSGYQRYSIRSIEGFDLRPELEKAGFEAGDKVKITLIHRNKKDD